jgi:AraC-like DNA-binding protein
LKINFSNYLSEKLKLDYTYLANIFSEDQGITIEHFIIAYKIQRVKELIAYNELNLTEISWKLNYSSVAHLSTQFKKVTGITPSSFKHLEHTSRIALENV